MDTPTRFFASDNNATVHPTILQAVVDANSGHAVGYGADPWTKRALAKMKEAFGPGSESFFVFNGTAANVLGLRAMTDTYNAIFCTTNSHIHVDECGAPERFTGCKLIAIKTADGKLTIDAIDEHLHGRGDEHHVQPGVISITQSTEVGTVYTPNEVRALTDFAHQRGMYLHMDGARLSNAAASLGLGLREISGDCGVDVLSFGGTKNGLLGGEAIVLFNPKLAEGFKYVRKQGMQLASKMRFISAQFEALLTDELWRKNATHANRMAQLLAKEVATVPGVRVLRPVQVNGVFATMPAEAISKLQEKAFFYVWDSTIPEVRWMTSFDTTEDDIHRFVRLLRETVTK